MTYVVESGASPARRARRRRAGITLLVVVIMLFFAFWYAYSYYRDDGRGAAAAPCVSTPTTTATLAPKDVIVNVYNATTRSGLAAKTAAEVRREGFVVQNVANDPLKKKLPGVAELRHGPQGAAAAKLVLAHFAGSVDVVDKRADESVDVVLGAGFKALTPVAVPTTSGSAPVTCEPSAAP